MLRSIAATTGHSRQKVTEVIGKAQVRQLLFLLTREMTDQWLEESLFPEKVIECSGYRPIDFEYIPKELAKKGVHLKLLHHTMNTRYNVEQRIIFHTLIEVSLATIRNSPKNIKR